MSRTAVDFVTEGGAAVGLGHLRRCLTLARELAALGASIQFAISGDTAAIELVRAEGFPVTRAANMEDAVAATIAQHPHVVIADSYYLSGEHFTQLKRAAGWLVAIDDIADREFPADIVVNSGVLAEELDYRALPETLFLLGPTYALLRREFAASPNRLTRERIERILITLGGGDRSVLTLALMKYINREFPKIEIHMVVGPFINASPELGDGASQEPGICIHKSPRDMHRLMLDADLAISGGGQTTYELAATGTPALAIGLASNQISNLQGFAKAGTLLYVGKSQDSDLPVRVQQELCGLATDARRRETMSARGRSMVDGKGAQRVAQAIMRQCEIR